MSTQHKDIFVVPSRLSHSQYVVFCLIISYRRFLFPKATVVSAGTTTTYNTSHLSDLTKHTSKPLYWSYF